MEKYSRVFHFDEPLYVEDSPVVVLAGAILKDNENESVVAQLKFKSISKKAIKGLEVELELFDASSEKQDKKAKHEYLDLNIPRNVEFGSKEPIKLPYDNSRSFVVSLKKVVYADGEVWTNSKKLYKLEQQEGLGTKLDSMQLKYFKEKYGVYAHLIPLEEKHLWMCTCGAYNHLNEEKCCVCNVSKKEIMSLDYNEFKKEALYELSCGYLETDSIRHLDAAIKNFEALKDYKDAKKKKEESTKKLKELKDLKAKKAKSRKKGLIILGSTILAIIAIIITVTVIIPNIIYTSGNKQYKDGNYEAAIAKFKKLPDFYERKKAALGKSYLKYGDQLVKEDKDEEALEMYDKISSKYMSSIEKSKLIKEVSINYADKLVKKAEYPKAIQIYERYNMYDELVSANYSYAMLLFEKKDYQNAHDKFMNSNNREMAAKSAIKAGDQLLAEKKYDEAIEWYKKDFVFIDYGTNPKTNKKVTAYESHKYVTAAELKYVSEHLDSKDKKTYEYLLDVMSKTATLPSLSSSRDKALAAYDNLYKFECSLVVNGESSYKDVKPTTIEGNSYLHYKISSNLPTGSVNIVLQEDYLSTYGTNYQHEIETDDVTVDVWHTKNVTVGSYKKKYKIHLFNADTKKMVCTSNEILEGK